MGKSRSSILVLIPILLVAVALGIWLFSVDFGSPNITSANYSTKETENNRTPPVGTAKNSPSSTNPPPVDTPPTNKEEAPPTDGNSEKHPQPERRKVRPVPVSDPVLDWSLSKADCLRVAKDDNAPKAQRTEAQARLLLDFTEWPGRDTQRLGGFAFDPGDYRELDGFKVSGDSIQAIPNGEPPNVLLERYVTFVKTTGQLTVTIRVMASRQWAQRFFLAWIAPPLSGDPTTPVLGKDRGILIGDVCQGSAEDKVQTQGTLFFVRHNVAVKLELLPIRRVEGAPVELNLVALAQKMDGVIRSQSQNASTWEDLEKFRPVIDEFVIVAEKLEQVKGKNRSDVTCVVHHPSGKKISFAHFEEVRGLSVVAKNGRPVDVGIALGGKYDAREYKIWLVVYDDSLLFSIAETSVPVQPQ